MSHFFERNPAIFDHCCKVVEDLHADLGWVCTDANEEIDFDLLLPWLLPEWSGRYRYACCLRCAREYVECLHKRDERAVTAREWLRRWVPGLWLPDLDVYERTTAGCRVLERDPLWECYVRATQRVRYRLDMSILEASLGAPIIRYLPAIQALSAFLLFDDDFVDLERDRSRGRQSLLIAWLENDESLPETCLDIVNSFREILARSLESGELLAQFANELVKAYVE